MMSYYELKEFIAINFEKFLNSDCFLPSIVLLTILFSIILYFALREYRKSKILIISDISAFSVTIKLNMKNIDIAQKIFIHLRTRKIGVPFEEDDVLIEIYKSWFSTFGAIRDLLLEVRPIPQNKIIVELGVKILNSGMRPHLTKWQARFRKWYEIQVNKPENENLSPQEIQRKFPEYNELISDLIQSQKEILSFLDSLEKIIAS